MGKDFCYQYLPGNGCKLPMIPGNYFAKYKDYNSSIAVTVPDDWPWLLEHLLPYLGAGKLDALIWVIFDGKWTGWSWQFEICF